MRSKYKVVCECGHEGEIVLNENDTPYGSSNWESYSLKNLKGNGAAVPYNSNWATVFTTLAVKCPECGISLSENNLKP